MNYAVIENGIVTNVYVADAPLNEADVFVTNQGIGWFYSNGTFTAPTPPASTPITLKYQAQVALAKSDITILRYYSASVAVPSTWQAYRVALRAIVNGTDTTSTELPSIPLYMAGT